MQATNTTHKHKFHAGQKCRIVSGRYAGQPGVIMFDEPVIGCDHGDEWFVDIAGRGMIPEIRECDMEPAEEEVTKPEPEPQPEPAAHHWAAGDRARIDSWSHVHHGFHVILTTRHLGTLVRKPYWEYQSIDGFDTELAVYEENLVPVPEPEPVELPAPTLYRVEYAVTGFAAGPDDAEGNWPMPSIVTSRRAALVPIAGIAERLKLAEVLEILHDAEDGHDDFIIGQIGGIPADPYAVGDRVTIVGGEHAGEAFYLIERDAGNGQRWWLSRRKDGEGWLGLHVDRFERDERGDV